MFFQKIKFEFLTELYENWLGTEPKNIDASPKQCNYLSPEKVIKVFFSLIKSFANIKLHVFVSRYLFGHYFSVTSRDINSTISILTDNFWF